MCDLLNLNIVDIVDGLLVSACVCPENSRNYILRTVVVHEVRIAPRITCRSERKVTNRDEGIDIHRVRHHTKGGVSLCRRRRTAQIERYLLALDRIYLRQSDPGIVTPVFGQIHTGRTAVCVTANMRILGIVGENTDLFRILRRSIVTDIISLSLEINRVRSLFLGCNRNERIAVAPCAVHCLYIYIVRTVPAVISLERLGRVAVSSQTVGAVHDLVRRSLSRINLFFGDHHVVSVRKAFPCDRGFVVTRINADLGRHLGCFLVLNGYTVEEECIGLIEIAQESYVVADTVIAGEVHYVLLEGSVTPHADGVHRNEGRDVLRIGHGTYDKAAGILTALEIVKSGPETYLALAEREVCIRRIRQRRSSYISVLVGRDRSGQVVSTREYDAGRSGLRIGAQIFRLRVHVDERIEVTGVVTPGPFRIATNDTRLIRHVETVAVRDVLRRFYTETELTLVRILTVPCTGLRFADRTQIDVVVLTGNELDILVLGQTAYLLTVNDDTRRIRNEVHGVRTDRILRHDQLILESVPARVPRDVDETGSLVGDRDVMRYGTLRRRAQFDTVQHNTTSQIIRSFERNLVSRIHLRQFQFHFLPVSGGLAVLC